MEVEEVINDILKDITAKVVQSTVEEAPIMILPLNVLSHLAEVMTWGWKFSPYRKDNPVSPFRLVCKRWNRAAIASFDIWKRLLLTIGPSHIGPSSVHNTPYYGRRTDCKKNAEGRCTIAFHYDSATLEPNYTASTAIQAYTECMKILGRKASAKKKARIKTLEKQYEIQEEKLKTAREEMKKRMKQ